jgi:hypothetical protein
MKPENEQPFTVARITAKVPSNPDERIRFAAALESVAAIFPADDTEPARSSVLHEATGRLISEGLDRFDPVDGTDWAEALADAYFAARLDFVARSMPSGGNA